MSATTRAVVLGAGRVGHAIALDLAESPSFEVTAVDRDATRARRVGTGTPVRFLEADLSDPRRVGALVSDCDLVIGAVPGRIGRQTLQAAIEAGKNVVDISFFEQDPFDLDGLARDRGVTAVVDCGVAPGLGNLVFGKLERDFDRIDRFVCMVGGIPEDPTPPWNYRAPYSPSDVIEVYTRPARIVRGGEIVTLPALSELETIEFPGVGLLEAFNTDGLRTLLRNGSVRDMAEKTLRYPGHRDQVALLAASGFFDEERVVNGAPLRPREVTSALLAEQWHQGETDYDITVMRLVAEGTREGEKVRVTWDLCDRFDREKGVSSMARTTGYPCAAVARLIARGDFVRPGIVAPESVGADPEACATVLGDLARRGVRFTVREEPTLT
jgi:saccharopine dehydrogenase-like NADP-dependent oxidoreductase